MVFSEYHGSKTRNIRHLTSSSFKIWVLLVVNKVCFGQWSPYYSAGCSFLTGHCILKIWVQILKSFDGVKCQQLYKYVKGMKEMLSRPKLLFGMHWTMHNPLGTLHNYVLVCKSCFRLVVILFLLADSFLKLKLSWFYKFVGKRAVGLAYVSFGSNIVF